MAYYDDYEELLDEDLLDNEDYLFEGLAEDDFDDDDFYEEEFDDEDDFLSDDFNREAVSLPIERRSRRRRGRRRRRGKKPSSRTRRRASVKSKGKMRYVNTVQLNKALAPINKHLNALKKDTVRLFKEANAMDSKYEQRTRTLLENTKANKKGIDGLQQQTLLTSLLGGPKLKKITLKGPGDSKTEEEFEITNVEQDNTMALILAMMSGGGFGKGSDSNSMLPLALIATQDSSGNGNDDNTLLILAMVMMNR